MTQCCSAIVRRPLFSQNFRKFFKETNISLTSSRAHRKLRIKTIQLNSIYQFAYNFKTVNAIKKIIADLKSVSWITYNSKIKMSGLRGTLNFWPLKIFKLPLLVFLVSATASCVLMSTSWLAISGKNFYCIILVNLKCQNSN